VLFKAPLKDSEVLLSHPTGLSGIVSIAGPVSAGGDSPFVALLTSTGKLRLLNFTIIESSQTYQKYIKDHYGAKLSNNASRRIEDTPWGQRMQD